MRERLKTALPNQEDEAQTNNFRRAFSLLGVIREIIEVICPEKGITARDTGDGKVEYKIGEHRIISYLMKTYKMPEYVARAIVSQMFMDGLITFDQSEKSSNWYYVIIRNGVKFS